MERKSSLFVETNGMEIVVVASKRRNPLVVEHLKDHPEHRVSWTPDFPFARTFRPKPDYRHIGIRSHVGPFRCFRGHQEAIKKISGSPILVFEDDCVPNAPNWYEIAQKAIPLLERFEIVSLHGRHICTKEEFEYDGMQFIIPGSPDQNKVNWSLGSLAYLISRKSADKITRMQYAGLPMDLLLATEFVFCVLKDSENTPFQHERKFGSLVEKAR